MALTVRYTRVLRYPVDADRSLAALDEAFADSDVALEVRRARHETNRIPDWVAVNFTAEHGNFNLVRDATEQRLADAGLADEFKPYGEF